MSQSQNDNMPQDPRLDNNNDQNHIFSEPEKNQVGSYQSKIRNIEEGYAHQQYQNKTEESTALQPEHDYYSQTTVEELNPSKSPYSDASVQKAYNKDSQIPQSFMHRFVHFCQKKWWLVLLLVLAVAAFSVALVLSLSNQVVAPSYSNIQASMQAPVTVSNNGQGVWKATFKNSESKEINNVTINFAFDKTFTYLNSFGVNKPTNSSGKTYVIDTLAANTEVTIEFAGILSGDIDETSFLSGSYTFTAADVAKPFSGNFKTVQTKITAGEVSLEVNAPTTAQDGTISEIKVTINNQSEKDITNVELRGTYPAGTLFEYQSSELSLSAESVVRRTPDKGNNTWVISSLPKLRSQTLIIRGKFSGSQGTRLPFKFQLVTTADRVLAELQKEVQMVVQPVNVTISFPTKETVGLFDPKEIIQVRANFTNQSDRDIQNIQLLVEFNNLANVIDFSKIQYTKGQGNVSGDQILFRGSGVPELVNLPAKGSGVIEFTMQIKDVTQFTTGTISQSKFLITPKITVSSAQIQSISTEGKSIKASGDLLFDQAVTCQKDTTGTETVCQVSWKLKNRQNNNSNVVIETTTNLPSNAWSEATIKKSQGEVSYNANTGKITWNVGRVTGYSGYTIPAATLTFELRIKTPEGGNTTLFLAPRITAEDEFTGQKYNFTGPIGRPQ